MNLKETIKVIGQDMKNLLSQLTDLKAEVSELKDKDTVDVDQRIFDTLTDQDKMYQLTDGLVYPFLAPVKDYGTGNVIFVPTPELRENGVYYKLIQDGKAETVDSFPIGDFIHGLERLDDIEARLDKLEKGE